ncbi:uncharacterized protein [Aegilops tauschii subsp. strangulata]|uniref:uncharacterized protein n=1 Tax=Aegilops tauschii subsp. strangulata TaxID=200361 RepID=UPI001ABC021C|nr:uncharacterized protein LOC109753607 [Aegilops tauschii subsp. strangulata]
MLNLSDHDEVQPDDVQEEIDLDDYDEMLKFLGPKRLEMLMTCQVMALKSMKMYYVVDDKLKDWVMGSAVMYRMAIQAFGSGQVHDESRNATTSKLRFPYRVDGALEDLQSAEELGDLEDLQASEDLVDL